MRHRLEGRKLGRPVKPRMAMLKNLSISIILEEKIVTTTAKAKEAVSMVDKLITKAKENTLHSRRQLLSDLCNNELAVKKLIESLAPRYADRTSGYTTTVKLENRHGDNAPRMMISLLSK
ncbi:50S ribosomal protein L17 [Candidatus Wirthbacteria bacterium CG2_30_54_11]|uniref:50S ribosomal protein L17 n=1 Tax=Candidatus Wirthbacteria bacterium CG2_30_54_11 TaxID=1817892 RepID=A0A1J5J3Q0_9BACT|nr:MAG: 50S ribosomal protein L17 [Candidatus Wirthbacteria bacterium CG2_30_54_11]